MPAGKGGCTRAAVCGVGAGTQVGVSAQVVGSVAEGAGSSAAGSGAGDGDGAGAGEAPCVDVAAWPLCSIRSAASSSIGCSAASPISCSASSSITSSGTSHVRSASIEHSHRAPSAGAVSTRRHLSQASHATQMHAVTGAGAAATAATAARFGFGRRALDIAAS